MDAVCGYVSGEGPPHVFLLESSRSIHSPKERTRLVRPPKSTFKTPRLSSQLWRSGRPTPNASARPPDTPATDVGLGFAGRPEPRALRPGAAPTITQTRPVGQDLDEPNAGSLPASASG